MEYYCSYQERCHVEVVQKMYLLNVPSAWHDALVVHLITNNFLNETRFAASFARGKFTQKKWGKTRIVSELKVRKISAVNIKLALQEIDLDAYEATFDALAQRTWDCLLERNPQKKAKKFCDYLWRKGWESERIYARLKELEQH